MIFQDPNKPDHGWKKPLMALIIVMLIGLVIGVFQKSYGYELPEKFRKWNLGTVNVYYKTDGCNIRTLGLIHRASRKWDVIETDDRGTTTLPIGYDQRVTLYCAETDPVELVRLPPGVSMQTDYLTDSQNGLVLASARSYWLGSSIVDCDIRLHPYFVTNSNVESVVAHEWGHCLGIDHSNNWDATMFYAPPIRSTLHADDLLAACELYQVCKLMDAEGNLAIRPIEYNNEWWYGYLPKGGVWPDDVVASRMDK